jgi:hypothetical protein
MGYEAQDMVLECNSTKFEKNYEVSATQNSALISGL